jgi:hypothetical protein
MDLIHWRGSDDLNALPDAAMGGPSNDAVIAFLTLAAACLSFLCGVLIPETVGRREADADRNAYLASSPDRGLT